jgi:thymidine kinase
MEPSLSRDVATAEEMRRLLVRSATALPENAVRAYDFKLILGPMFSGKTTLLLAEKEREELAGSRCICFKWEKDRRYEQRSDEEFIQTSVVVGAASSSSFKQPPFGADNPLFPLVEWDIKRSELNPAALQLEFCQRVLDCISAPNVSVALTLDEELRHVALPSALNWFTDHLQAKMLEAESAQDKAARQKKHAAKIHSHSKLSADAFACSKLFDTLRLPPLPGSNLVPSEVEFADWIPHKLAEVDVILIDEIHFFEHADVFVRFVTDVLGKTVIASGVNGSYDLRPLGCMPDLLPLATDIQFVKAVCQGQHGCREPAVRSHRTASDHQEQFMVGGAESYKTLCPRHYALANAAQTLEFKNRLFDIQKAPATLAKRLSELGIIRNSTKPYYTTLRETH